MTRNKSFERLYGFYLYMHHHGIPLREMADFEKEEWEKMGRDLEVLDQLKEILSMDYLVRVYGYDMAKKLQTYLKSNDIVKEWLDA